MHTAPTPVSASENQKALVAILEEIEKLTPCIAEDHIPIRLRSLIWAACETIKGCVVAPDQSLTQLVRKRLLTSLESAHAVMEAYHSCEQRQIEDLIRISSDVYLSIDMYRRTM
ncbi:hypothetical protein QNI16_10680 [Cytophagaceae bacterium YF14B1]|uniref:Uncharacterized protein n=1 Tax=Xanthocytophaga flava TaxID=3048013 RepID=A0AAE3U6U9_9BACT|nr:hypothetical protein [Xanthocytophaga flavus]MDJ1480947.1 hypothetical protein [Xanthocytophaga flavus]